MSGFKEIIWLISRKHNLKIKKIDIYSRYTSSYHSWGVLENFRPQVANIWDASNSPNTWKTNNKGETSFVLLWLPDVLRYT